MFRIFSTHPGNSNSNSNSNWNIRTRTDVQDYSSVFAFRMKVNLTFIPLSEVIIKENVSSKFASTST